MHKIAVLSDTHGILREEAIENIKNCEVILHAGDIGSYDILEKLKKIAPLYVVRGNIDKERWAEKIPEELYFNLYGFMIYMIHDKAQIRTDVLNAGSEIDILITGHSHKYEARQENGVYFLNPGSCGPKRFWLAITMAVITLDEKEHKFFIEKIDFSDALKTGKKTKQYKKSQENMPQLIKEVIKEMDAGRAVSDIARRNKVDEELVDQICRIYSTHPGVDVDGILNRMEIWGL